MPGLELLALLAVAMIAAQMTRMHRVSNLRWAADEARNAYMAKGTAEPTSALLPGAFRACSLVGSHEHRDLIERLVGFWNRPPILVQ